VLTHATSRELGVSVADSGENVVVLLVAALDRRAEDQGLARRREELPTCGVHEAVQTRRARGLGQKPVEAAVRLAELSRPKILAVERDRRRQLLKVAFGTALSGEPGDLALDGRSDVDDLAQQGRVLGHLGEPTGVGLGKLGDEGAAIDAPAHGDIALSAEAAEGLPEGGTRHGELLAETTLGG